MATTTPAPLHEIDAGLVDGDTTHVQAGTAIHCLAWYGFVYTRAGIPKQGYPNKKYTFNYFF